MWRVVRALARDVIELIYPSTCLICDTLQHADAPFRHNLCSNCYSEVVTDRFPACPRCAQTVGPHSDTADGCTECRGVALGFDRAFRLGSFAGKLREAVLRIKQVSGEGLADFLGRILAEQLGDRLKSANPDLVVPIPLHWWCRFHRGYNQAEAIARELAAKLGVPFTPNLIRRVRGTSQHAQSSRAARVENMKGAFQARHGARLAGKTVLLIDDVMTTGSTLGEAARTLKAAGAKHVLAVVLARA